MGSKLGVQRARLHSRDSLELADAGRVSSKRLSRRRRRNESHTSQDLPRCSSDQLTTNTQSARSVTHMNSRSTSPQPPPRRDLVRRLSSTSSAQRIPSAATTPTTRRPRTSSAAPMDSKQRRILEAERILNEIANEYAAKRAAGLVPTMPVPARTLLWEELARNERNRIGKRGQCLFGRDTDSMCGCTSYKKKKIPGQSNPGGVCECCNHGGPWHRLHGGGMTTTMTSRSTRSSVRSRSRNSTRTASLMRSEGRATSVYSYKSEDYGDDDYEDNSDYDSDEDDDDDEDDEDIANEVARPYAAGSPRVPPSYMLSSPRSPQVPPLTPTALRTPTLPDRSSIFSTRSSLGLPPRLSNQSNRLEVLLKAIEGYRSMGLSEDEVEERIREDFPPVDRLSVSTSNRSFVLGSM